MPVCQISTTALRSGTVAPREQALQVAGHGVFPVGLGAINNDSELIWAVDSDEKVLDVDGRGKHGTDKVAYMGSLDGNALVATNVALLFKGEILYGPVILREEAKGDGASAIQFGYDYCERGCRGGYLGDTTVG